VDQYTLRDLPEEIGVWSASIHAPELAGGNYFGARPRCRRMIRMSALPTLPYPS
jgi:hypothetical protein